MGNSVRKVGVWQVRAGAVEKTVFIILGQLGL